MSTAGQELLQVEETTYFANEFVEGKKVIDCGYSNSDLEGSKMEKSPEVDKTLVQDQTNADNKSDLESNKMDKSPEDDKTFRQYQTNTDIVDKNLELEQTEQAQFKANDDFVEKQLDETTDYYDTIDRFFDSYKTEKNLVEYQENFVSNVTNDNCNENLDSFNVNLIKVFDHSSNNQQINKVEVTTKTEGKTIEISINECITATESVSKDSAEYLQVENSYENINTESIQSYSTEAVDNEKTTNVLQNSSNSHDSFEKHVKKADLEILPTAVLQTHLIDNNLDSSQSNLLHADLGGESTNVPILTDRSTMLLQIDKISDDIKYIKNILDVHDQNIAPIDKPISINSQHNSLKAESLVDINDKDFLQKITKSLTDRDMSMYDRTYVGIEPTELSQNYLCSAVTDTNPSEINQQSSTDDKESIQIEKNEDLPTAAGNLESSTINQLEITENAEVLSIEKFDSNKSSDASLLTNDNLSTSKKLSSEETSEKNIETQSFITNKTIVVEVKGPSNSKPKEEPRLLINKLQGMPWLKPHAVVESSMGRSRKSKKNEREENFSDTTTKNFNNNNVSSRSDDSTKNKNQTMPGLPIKPNELTSQVNKMEESNVWNKNPIDQLFPNAQLAKVEDEQLSQAIADSICTAQQESEKRKLGHGNGKIKINDISDDNTWGQNVRRNLPDEELITYDTNFDKYGRVEGYSEKHLFMGQGARRKEQEFLKSQSENANSSSTKSVPEKQPPSQASKKDASLPIKTQQEKEIPKEKPGINNGSSKDRRRGSVTKLENNGRSSNKNQGSVVSRSEKEKSVSNQNLSKDLQQQQRGQNAKQEVKTEVREQSSNQGSSIRQCERDKPGFNQSTVKNSCSFQKSQSEKRQSNVDKIQESNKRTQPSNFDKTYQTDNKSQDNCTRQYDNYGIPLKNQDTLKKNQDQEYYNRYQHQDNYNKKQNQESLSKNHSQDYARNQNSEQVKRNQNEGQFSKNQSQDYSLKNQHQDCPNKNQGIDYCNRNQRQDYSNKNQGQDYCNRNQSQDYSNKNQGHDYSNRNQSQDYSNKNQGHDYSNRNQSQDYSNKNTGQDYFNSNRNQSQEYSNRNQTQDYSNRNQYQGQFNKNQDHFDKKYGQDFLNKNKDLVDRKQSQDSSHRDQHLDNFSKNHGQDHSHRSQTQEYSYRNQNQDNFSKNQSSLHRFQDNSNKNQTISDRNQGGRADNVDYYKPNQTYDTYNESKNNDQDPFKRNHGFGNRYQESTNKSQNNREKTYSEENWDEYQITKPISNSQTLFDNKNQQKPSTRNVNLQENKKVDIDNRYDAGRQSNMNVDNQSVNAMMSRSSSSTKSQSNSSSISLDVKHPLHHSTPNTTISSLAAKETKSDLKEEITKSDTLCTDHENLQSEVRPNVVLAFEGNQNVQRALGLDLNASNITQSVNAQLFPTYSSTMMNVNALPFETTNLNSQQGSNFPLLDSPMSILPLGFSQISSMSASDSSLRMNEISNASQDILRLHNTVTLLSKQLATVQADLLLAQAKFYSYYENLPNSAKMQFQHIVQPNTGLSSSTIEDESSSLPVNFLPLQCMAPATFPTTAPTVQKVMPTDTFPLPKTFMTAKVQQQDLVNDQLQSNTALEQRMIQQYLYQQQQQQQVANFQQYSSNITSATSAVPRERMTSQLQSQALITKGRELRGCGNQFYNS